MEIWEIETRSGSVYRITRDGSGQWWVGGENVQTPMSHSLVDGTWEIDPPTPWPPVLGSALEFRAPPDLALDDPTRIPGGGKLTSSVMSVRVLAPVRMPLGQLVMTPAALAVVDQREIDLPGLLKRHLSGDWGEIGQDGYDVNIRAATEWHGTVLSSYGKGADRISIATSIGHDGVTTTVMLPSEW